MESHQDISVVRLPGVLLKRCNNVSKGRFHINGQFHIKGQFHINGYEVRARRDRDKSGGGLMEFVRKSFICKRLKKLEPKFSEVICSEFTILNKKWICFSVYRPSTQNNLECFFNELTTSLSQASVMCDNFIVMGDFNIDVNLPSHEHEKSEEFCNLFDLPNLIKSNACFTKRHIS